jgi:hypothetical protein
MERIRNSSLSRLSNAAVWKFRAHVRFVANTAVRGFGILTSHRRSFTALIACAINSVQEDNVLERHEFADIEIPVDRTMMPRLERQRQYVLVACLLSYSGGPTVITK